MSGFVSALSTASEAVSAIASLAFGATGGVVLGQFVFSGFEVPKYISIPGNQAMTVHKLPGGERVIDVLGDDPGDISWSGCMIDGDPWTRAQELEQMRSLGDPLPLQWGQFFYTVVIRSFAAKTLYSRVNYEISCTVLQNEATAPTQQDPPASSVVQGGATGALSAVSGALQQAATLIHSGLSVVSSVAGQVSSLANAVGVSIPFLGEAQEAIGMANGFASQLSSVSAAGFSLANTTAALAAGAAASYGGSAAMGDVMSGVSADAPSGDLVGSADDLQTATYAAGAQAQMQQAGDYSGSAAVSLSSDTGTDPATTVADTAPSSYSDPSPLANSGPPNSAMSYTANQVNTSGDPTQSLYMSKSITYDSTGAATVTYSPQPAVPGQLTAADAKAAGF